MPYYRPHGVICVFGFFIDLVIISKYYLYVVSVYDKFFDVVIKRRIYVVLHRLYFIKFNPTIK